MQRPLKIHFNNVNWSSSSGPNTFAYRLAHQLSMNGHQIADPNDCDIDLIFIEKSVRNVDPKAKSCQRLDGIWSKKEEIAAGKNKNIQDLYHIADEVIFQSYFDSEYIRKQWGPPKTDYNYSVIHNGIELKESITITIGPIIDLWNQYDFVFVSAAAWHAQKRLKANTECFLHLKQFYPNSCFIVLGSNADYKVGHKDIFYAGHCSHEECEQLYTLADWMIHLSHADHSPNTVIEALANNCKVIHSECGGTKELVQGNGLCLKESAEFKFEPFDYDNPPTIDVTQIKEPLPEIKVNRDYLDIKLVAKKYEEVFEKLV